MSEVTLAKKKQRSAACGLLGDVPLAHNPLRARGGTELRAVKRDQSGSDLAAEQHECPARPHDSRPVLPPEVRNRLEVRSQPSQQPHELNITPAGIAGDEANLHLQPERTRCIPHTPRFGFRRALALFRNGRDDVVISGLTCGTDPTTSDFVMSEAMLHMLAGRKFTLSQAEIAM
jgi:hypothetical protein